jgi:ATP/maltotriose-dependent transcriptional regulator MalT/DNA-binding SARP family transcriptional activator
MKDDELIVRTKLDTPPIKGRILRRERLLSTLKENLDKKLILICADAGYGKTTLLAQFCHELKSPFIFYDLDSQDNDTATFFNYLVAGMKKHVSGFGERVRSVVYEKRSHEIIIGTFINEFLEKIDGEFYIILDDYHRLHKNRTIVKIISYFLRHLPSNLHFVISSRTTPPIYLSYYLAKQELLHLGKEHLQFDIEETRALFRDVYGLDIQKEDITRIAELSEGWVTVIQLILQKLSVTGSGRVRQTLNNYIASGEDVFDYFAQEVFKNQSKTVRDFLMTTSVLEYLNPRICDHVLGIRASEKIIDKLETEHVFVLRAGDNLLYHPLFQEFLYKIFTNSYPAQYGRRLHTTAGDYFYKQKEYSLAVRHLIHARRYARAAKILDKHFEHWLLSSEYATFVKLAGMIPGTFLDTHPYLLLKVARMCLELMKVQRGLKVADKALKRLRRTRDLRGMAKAYEMKWLGYHILMQSRRALYAITKAYRLVGSRRSREKVEIMMSMGTAYRILGKFSKAEKILQETLEMARVLKNTKLECDALHKLGMLYYNMSHLKQAEKTFTQIATKFRDQVCPLELAYTYRTIASIAIDNGDLANALDHIERAEAIVQQYSDRYLSSYLVLLRGRVNVYQGNYVKAIELFKRVIELNQEVDVRISDLYALLDLVGVYLQMNDVRSGREALNQAEAVLVQSQDIPQHVIIFQIVKGRLETAEGKFAKAQSSLNNALQISKKVYDPYQVMMIYYALSDYYLVRRQISKAFDNFKKCLAIVRKHDFVAYLAFEGRTNLALFELALEEKYMADFVLSILKRINTDKAQDIVQRLSIEKRGHDLECNYLGQLEIKDVNGRVITANWRTNRAKALFIMLSMNHPKGCTKDELVGACWPQRPLSQAVHSLQVELSALRKMIRKLVDSEFDSDNIITFRDQIYSLNPRMRIKKDVQEFEVLINGAAARETTDRAQSIQLYNQALVLYRGDFCDDLRVDWCADMRPYFKEMALRAMKKLAQFSYDAGDVNQALALFREAESRDPYDEKIHIGIMRCLTVLKDSDGVQKQYQMLVSALSELDISSPSREATQLYQESLG